MLEINKLIESDVDQLREIGWMLYSTDVSNGLTEYDTYKIIKLLSEIEAEDVTDEDYREAYNEGYEEGFHDGRYSTMKTKQINKKQLDSII